jgi:hypothetical protein
MEEWRAIPEYEGIYEISSCGNVKSLARYMQPRKDRRAYWVESKTLSTHCHKNGYMFVCLSKDGNKKTFSVHRLLLRAFVGEPKNKEEACHANGIRKDNKIQNLRWDSRINNFKDRDKHGNTAIGEKNGMAKINDQIVKDILAEELSTLNDNNLEPKDVNAALSTAARLMFFKACDESI